MGTSDFKVLLYTEMRKTLGESGLGKAIRHQERALKKNGITYTLNPRDDFDVAHINYYGPNSYQLAKWAKKHGKKVVYHAHSTEEDFRNSFVLSNKIAPSFKKWLVKCYKLGDIIVTPTEYSKKLLTKYGLKNIRVVSNGVDTEFFKKDEKLGRSFRKKYGFLEEDKVIVGIGLYIERKGILDFIKLAEKMPEYQFIWFGHTNWAIIPGKIRKALSKNLPNLQFPGHVPAEMIKSALSGADLFLFPSFEETEGIPVLEGLACEQKTIIRDIPVFSWLEDGKTVYKAKNLKDFEQKVRAVLEGELPSLVKAGRKVAEEYDERKVGEKLVGVYREVLGTSVKEPASKAREGGRK